MIFGVLPWAKRHFQAQNTEKTHSTTYLAAKRSHALLHLFGLFLICKQTLLYCHLPDLVREVVRIHKQSLEAGSLYICHYPNELQQERKRHGYYDYKE